MCNVTLDEDNTGFGWHNLPINNVTGTLVKLEWVCDGVDNRPLQARVLKTRSTEWHHREVVVALGGRA